MLEPLEPRACPRRHAYHARPRHGAAIARCAWPARRPLPSLPPDCVLPVTALSERPPACPACPLPLHLLLLLTTTPLLALLHCTHLHCAWRGATLCRCPPASWFHSPTVPPPSTFFLPATQPQLAGRTPAPHTRVPRPTALPMYPHNCKPPVPACVPSPYPPACCSLPFIPSLFAFPPRPVPACLPNQHAHPVFYSHHITLLLWRAPRRPLPTHFPIGCRAPVPCSSSCPVRRLHPHARPQRMLLALPRPFRPLSVWPVPTTTMLF